MSWDVIGHEWAVRLLKRHIADQRALHAYLFLGPESVGKRTLANRFAQALSCEQTPAPGMACHECRACRLIDEGTFPDLHVLAPDPSIQVDDVRALQRRLALAPYEGAWRIALLEDFHRASASASNAMLKTLEEPPDQVVLLLTATAQALLLPTVVSRCEVIRLRGVPTSTISQALQDQAVESGKAEMLAVLSEGRPGRALRWQSDPDRFERRSNALDQLNAALNSDLGGRFALADEIVGRGKIVVQRNRVRSTLEPWLSLWRDALYQGYQAEVQPRNPDRLPSFATLVESVAPAERHRVVRALSDTLSAVDSNANLRLAVEALMLKLPATR
ncbi:MAG: DNA polymerase III subunit delta' [Anaerolineales bacterium]